jgi:hypothetical protein
MVAEDTRLNTGEPVVVAVLEFVADRNSENDIEAVVAWGSVLVAEAEVEPKELHSYYMMNQPGYRDKLEKHMDCCSLVVGSAMVPAVVVLQ